MSAEVDILDRFLERRLARQIRHLASDDVERWVAAASYVRAQSRLFSAEVVRLGSALDLALSGCRPAETRRRARLLLRELKREHALFIMRVEL